MLACKARLQAGRCFSQVPFGYGQPFCGLRFRGFPGRSERDHILAAAYMTIENVEYFLLAYKTIVNIVLSLLGHIRPS